MKRIPLRLRGAWCRLVHGRRDGWEALPEQVVEMERRLILFRVCPKCGLHSYVAFAVKAQQKFPNVLHIRRDA
jgi:hypothetical protein